MNLFFTKLIDHDIAQLDESESKHAIQVLRMRKDDPVHFVDGDGGLYEGKIEEAHPKRCKIRILKKTENHAERSYFLHIGVAPTKNIDRFEWILEKATELGVDRITPLLCDRSERKIIKKDRLLRVIESAMKQSLKARLPLLDDLTPFQTVISAPHPGQKMIAHCQDDEKVEIVQVLKPHGNHLILIGPEGDFSPGEITSASNAHFLPVRLGESRLRTETAAICACSAVYLVNTTTL